MSSTPDTSSVPLYAASKAIGMTCSEPNLVFMKCKQQHDHPSKCLEPGEKVAACVLKVLRQLEEKTPAEYKAHQECLKNSSRHFERCRETERALYSSFNTIETPAESTE